MKSSVQSANKTRQVEGDKCSHYHRIRIHIRIVHGLLFCRIRSQIRKEVDSSVERSLEGVVRGNGSLGDGGRSNGHAGHGSDTQKDQSSLVCGSSIDSCSGNTHSGSNAVFQTTRASGCLTAAATATFTRRSSGRGSTAARGRRRVRTFRWLVWLRWMLLI